MHSNIYNKIYTYHIYFEGRAWQLMPVIPALWEAKVRGLPELRGSRPTWATWQNPVFTKKHKN